MIKAVSVNDGDAEGIAVNLYGYQIMATPIGVFIDGAVLVSFVSDVKKYAVSCVRGGNFSCMNIFPQMEESYNNHDETEMMLSYR